MAKELANGILNMHKPQGVTSMDVVRLVKRLTRVKRVGHAGTLDPIATGVLPICLGQATRLMEHMIDGRKIYRGELTLGTATDSYDADGEVTATADPSGVTKAQVEALLPLFTGNVEQMPPMFSALKHEGQRLYDLARAGVEVERPPRDVVVHQLTLISWDPPKLTIEAECGRGFYIRTLAHDIGQALGCGAHLSALARIKAGTFTLDEAIEPSELEAKADDEAWRDLLLPPDAAVTDLDTLTVDPSAERHLRNGQAISLRSMATYAEHAEQRRVYSQDGRFLAVARFNRAQNHWQPDKVFDLPEPSALAPATS